MNLRTAPASLRAHLDEILVVTVLAAAVGWFLAVDASTIHLTSATVSPPVGFAAGADDQYLEAVAVAVDTSEVRRLTAEASGQSVDRIYRRLEVGDATDRTVVVLEDRSAERDRAQAGLVITAAVQAAHDVALTPPSTDELRRTTARIGERLEQIEEVARRGSGPGTPLGGLVDTLARIRDDLSREQVATDPDGPAIADLIWEAEQAIDATTVDVADDDLRESLGAARRDIERLGASIVVAGRNPEALLEIGPTVERQQIDRPYGQAVLVGLATLALAWALAVLWDQATGPGRSGPAPPRRIPTVGPAAGPHVSIEDRLADHVPGP